MHYFAEMSALDHADRLAHFVISMRAHPATQQRQPLFNSDSADTN
jgi:hypothetical protein